MDDSATNTTVEMRTPRSSKTTISKTAAALLNDGEGIEEDEQQQQQMQTQPRSRALLELQTQFFGVSAQAVADSLFSTALQCTVSAAHDVAQTRAGSSTLDVKKFANALAEDERFLARAHAATDQLGAHLQNYALRVPDHVTHPNDAAKVPVREPSEARQLDRAIEAKEQELIQKRIRMEELKARCETLLFSIQTYRDMEAAVKQLVPPGNDLEPADDEGGGSTADVSVLMRTVLE